MTPERVSRAAGFTAGSMATIEIAKRERRVWTATTVAVLHATTMAFAPSLTKNSAIASARFAMKLPGRLPYGAWPESATYSRSSPGNARRISRKTERPPTPESNTPMGAPCMARIEPAPAGEVCQFAHCGPTDRQRTRGPVPEKIALSGNAIGL